MEFKEHLEKYLSKNDINQLIDSFSLSSKHALLLNLNKMSDEQLKSLFPRVIPHPIVPHAYIYDKNEYDLGKSIYHELGCFYLQEPSAMVVSYLLDVKPNDLVLDMCAAPGGKTIGTSLKMGTEGLIISNDINKERTRALVDNISRIGLKNAIVTNNNFSYIYQYYLNTFDKIILDAPCSGSGMFRKDDKMKDDWSINKVFKYAMTQYQLIDMAYAMLKPGGSLIYSTCSYSYEEDEEVIKHLLSSSDAEIIDINNSPLFYSDNSKLGVHLFPHIFPGEGHYICLIKKPGILKNTNFIKSKNLSNLLPKEVSYFNTHKFGDYLFILPNEIAYKKLNIVLYGINAGEIIKNNIIYSYQLSHVLSGFSNKIELNKDEVTNYINGQQINKTSPYKGNVLLTYQDIPVDFSKTNGEVIKNHYPKYLRKINPLFY